VPLNTQAPLTLPGMLSTAGHWDQSRADILETPSLQITAKRRDRHAGSGQLLPADTGLTASPRLQASLC
jgi:hypothetical protein